jgi:carbon monoxide dehydrogenase subunit G
MQLTAQQTLPVGQAQAWEALNDTTLLQQAIPGCEGLTPIGEHQYEVHVLAAIGPVKAKFKGKLQLENLQPPNGYTLRFEGQGGAAGHGKGTAEIKLEAKGPRETILHYTAHATVGGKIAQVGSRLVDMAAQKMAGEFFERFNTALQARYPAPAEAEVVAAAPADAPQGFFGKLIAFLKKLFGG